MSPANPLDILLAHDHWATRNLLLACQNLPPEQFAQKFDMGPGSLQATVTHIIGAMRRWNDSLTGRPLAPRIDQSGTLYSPGELLPMLDQAADELKAEAARLPLDQTLSRTFDGKTVTFTRAAIFTQVTTHAMHHRAQCLNMLKQLGVKPLPPSSVIEWTFVTNA